MKRKEQRITRSEWNNYVAWSNTQHKARTLTEIDNTPVHIAFASHDDAHSEPSIVAEECTNEQ